MSELAKIQEDLNFIRRAVTRAEGGGFPPSIAFLWAAIVLVGFALVDFAPQQCRYYWMVAAPAGFVASAFLGYRSSRRIGQVDRSEGMRQMLHWFGLMAAIFLSALAVESGAVTWQGFGATALLLTALAYYLAGVHGSRSILWVGLVLAAGYPVVLFLPATAWTVVGILAAVALVGAGLAGVKRDVPAHR